MSQIVASRSEKNMLAVESALVKNDISQLTTEEKLVYYDKICESVGLNKLTKPFAFLTLNGREVLYATKDCTEQLRKIHGVSTQIVSKGMAGDLFEVHVKARDKTGKEDDDLAYVVVNGLSGNNLANAMLKCVTKAKRRVTLSICGLGLLDESEVETIKDVSPASNPQVESHFKKMDEPVFNDPENNQIDPVPVLESDLGSYFVKFGKHINRKLSEFNLNELTQYSAWLVTESVKNNKPLTGVVLEFDEKATAYINQRKIDDVGF